MKITVCLGTCCHLMGSYEIYQYLESESQKNCNIELSTSVCIDACNTVDLKAPVIVVNGKLYSEMTVPKIKELIKEVK